MFHISSLLEKIFLSPYRIFLVKRQLLLYSRVLVRSHGTYCKVCWAKILLSQLQRINILADAVFAEEKGWLILINASY